MNYKIKGAVAIAIFACLYQQGFLGYTLLWILRICMALLGTGLGVTLVICRGKKYVPPPVKLEPSKANLLLVEMMKARELATKPQKKVVLSRNLDMAIQEVLDLVTRDYVLSWYTDLATDKETFPQMLQDEIWEMTEHLSEALSKIDLVKLMTADLVDILCGHFKDIRYATIKDGRENVKQEFLLHPWLQSEEKETEFLRKVADVLLIHFLPNQTSACQPMRHLLRELVACRVFKPTIERLCDPDYINQTLISYLDFREKLWEEHNKTYAYAASYEDFMKMIEESDDIEQLKGMRYSIISEIMQATTINNLKKAQGLESEKRMAPKSSTKGDLLKSRNLKRYINQLKMTKKACGKRIRTIGGQDYRYYGDEEEEETQQTLPGKKVMSFQVVLDNAEARHYFMKFLQRDDNHSLLKFWEAVERLKHTEKKLRHQLASEIYQMYIASPSSVVKEYVKDRTTLKGMEAFMMGNKGPDAFFTAQSQTVVALETNFYGPFIVSDIYHKYIEGMSEDFLDTFSMTSREDSSGDDLDKSDSEDDTDVLATHSAYAKQKLRSLDSKISDKEHALEAMKWSSKAADTKYSKLKKDLEAEIESLRSDRRQLEFHIERTATWWENVGCWKAHIYSAEALERDDKTVAYFSVVVDLIGSPAKAKSFEDSTKGWVVSRSLQDFQMLHRKLAEIGPWLAKKELPATSKLWFKSINQSFLDKAKVTLEDYLTTVLKDDQMCHSEALYAFLSPSPEHLKEAGKKLKLKPTKFSLTNILKSIPVPGKDTNDSEDDLLFMDEETAREDRSKDSIAEPSYKLVAEVFELKGLFKLFRKSLIAFVQVTFGRSINRQLREMVEWVFSEPMLIYYIHLFRDSLWPGGVLAPTPTARSDEEKLKTRMTAKQKVLGSIPDALKNLVGERNARQGTIKIFEVFQDCRLNKHLFYLVLQHMLLEVCPSIKEQMQATPPPSPAPTPGSPPPDDSRQSKKYDHQGAPPAAYTRQSSFIVGLTRI